FFSSRRRHTRFSRDWSSDVCSSDLMRTHNDAWRKYTPKPYAGHITLFRAMEESDHSAPQPDMGWGEIAKEGVSVYDVPGNHLTRSEERRVGKDIKCVWCT